MSQPNAIHMGHGQMVDIVARSETEWELVFSEAGVAAYKAPPLGDIKVEAIDAAGAIHPLTVGASGSISSVLAAGHVAGAYRARVMVMHGDHMHTRESLLPGKQAIAAKPGPGGGTLIEFAAASVEAKLVADDSFELRFFAGAAPIDPPAPEHAVAQAIGPSAENYQIRNLAMRSGDLPRTLVASGKIKDATYLRLTVKTGAAQEIRSVPVIR